MELKDKDFIHLKDLIYELTGICIAEHKRELVRNRIIKRVNQLRINSISEYCEYINDINNHDEIENLINAISTNKTEFYREQKHFDFLTEILEDKYNHHTNKELYIWSAACSTGEEPYSIALTVYESLQQISKMDVKILATDIDTEVLKKASAGVYEKEKLNTLSHNQIRKYFARKEEKYEVKEEIKRIIRFRHLNLIKDFPFNKKFDFIFCRNVMIYFDLVTQQNLVNKLYNHTKEGGYLFVGHTEALSRLNVKYNYISPSIYKKI